MEFKYIVVFITTPAGKGEEIAQKLVEEKLAACVNVVDKVSSLYWWQGKIEKDKENLLVVKTKADLFKKLVKRVKEIHPYTVPEIIALPIVDGNEDYLSWIDESVNP
ncbi:MAG: divalent-cation tolerance protein CutA [Aquificae bacterium]|jgi:periplasmic divalent cation tolerance protein|nr:divalent-cation tolerance protein CutA [Aquificota bacterium]